jgi:hypothetical protein
MRIVLGLIGCILSILLMIYRGKVIHFMGPVAWAERHLGGGGTYTLLVLVGILGFIFSLMYMTNSFDVLFGGGAGVDFFESVK